MAGNGRMFRDTGSDFGIGTGERGMMAKTGMMTCDAGTTAQSINQQAELLQQQADVLGRRTETLRQAKSPK